MKKSDLRALYLERRRSLSSDQLTAASRTIADILFESVSLRDVKRLHCFISIEKFHEIDTNLIFERIWREYPSVETVAPRVNFETGEIESVTYTAESELLKNNWGVQEPVSGETVDNRTIDAVLVPLLCFDKKGYRVGYGRGYYDRFLAQCRNDCRKIGLSIFGPVKEIEDAARYDIALDLFITPDGLFQPRRK